MTSDLKKTLEKNSPKTIQRHIHTNTPGSLFSVAFYGLNRAYAYWASSLNALIYGFLYTFCGGIPPSRNTRPKPREGYTPSVFVTGAHDGIGRATAFLLAKDGWTVFAGVRVPEEKEDLRTEFEEYVSSLSPRKDGLRVYGTLRPIVCDVLDGGSIKFAAQEVERFVSGDPRRPFVAVVNNAGYCMISPMELTSRQDVTRMVDTMLLAYIDVTKAFFPLLKQTKGRVVNIGSYGGYAAIPGWTTYAGVKAAIEHLTRSWSLETTRTLGIRMATVRPGMVASHAIGPGISQGITSWKQDNNAIGFDSQGHAMLAEDGREVTGEERQAYARVMDRNAELIEGGIEGGTPAVNVAKTVRDALTEAWMQPVYTVGVDALLGQAARDLLPEAVYEWMTLKSFA